MQHLTQQDLLNFQFKARSPFKKKFNPFRTPLQGLGKGDSLLISTNEWTKKSPPSTNLLNLTKELGIKLKCRTLLDDSGWVLTRIK